MSGGWRAGLRRRALQGVPHALQVNALLRAQGVCGALPGGRGDGVLCFELAEQVCERVREQGLAWLARAVQARGRLDGEVAHYLPWRSGTQALAEIGVAGAPAGWPHAAPVYACRDPRAGRWLLVLPTRRQLWLGWQA